MLIILLITILVVGFLVQYVLGFIQIKYFTKHYIEFRKKGKVAIGRRPAIIRSGTLVLLQLNNKNEIERAGYLQGVTVFTRFKEINGLKGKKINKLTKNDFVNFNKLLARAIMDAQYTFNIVQSGGEIADIPSPMMKVIRKANGMLLRKE